VGCFAGAARCFILVIFVRLPFCCYAFLPLLGFNISESYSIFHDFQHCETYRKTFDSLMQRPSLDTYYLCRQLFTNISN
jgi:hypothetical protein